MKIQLTHPNGRTYEIDPNEIRNYIRVTLEKPYISYTHLQLKGSKVCVCLETEEEIKRKLLL